MEGLEHERAFFERFVVAPQRERWLALVEAAAGGNERQRRRLTDGLNHKLHRELDPEHVTVIEPARYQPGALAEAIEAATGLNEAYCIACESYKGEYVDGGMIALDQALRVDQGFGVVLSIVAGKLAIHLPEMGPGKPERYLPMRDLKAGQVEVIMKAVR